MSATIEILLEPIKNRNTIRGNITFLGSPYEVKTFINQNNETIAYAGYENEADSNNETIINDEDDSLVIEVPRDKLQDTLKKLNRFKEKFKRDFPGINLDYIKSEVNEDEDNDDRPLNIDSLVYAIQSIWEMFPSKNVKKIKEEQYVNDAYIHYVELYEDEKDKYWISNKTRRYINPLLFPKIFELVFPKNEIPFSRKEINFLSSDDYNHRVSLHNKDFDEDDPESLRLFIYRNTNQINKIKEKRREVDNKKINNIIKDTTSIKKKMSRKAS